MYQKLDAMLLKSDKNIIFVVLTVKNVLTMGFIVTLILVGLVLIFVEVLLIPGVGIAGILGLLSLAGTFSGSGF